MMQMPTAWFRFQGGIFEAKDGALLASCYGEVEGDSKMRSMLAKSSDGGVNWSVISTIAYDAQLDEKYPKCEGFNETSVVRCADGSLLAVIRIGSNLPLHQCRSTNDGLTWSAPVKLPGQPDRNILSVNPQVRRISNGMLVLCYGRPGMKMLLSTDGRGDEWTNYTDLMPTGITTGYPAIVEVTPNRLLLVGDTGANWQYKMDPFPSPNPFSIWGKFIEIETSRFSQ